MYICFDNLLIIHYLTYMSIKSKTFLDEKTELLNNLPACTGDTARLAFALSQALNRLDAIISQAEAQFRAGDTHATFNKQTIESVKSSDLFSI